MKKNQTQKIVYIAILTALATVLMFFNFPIPFFPSFLKFDLSDVIIFSSSIFVGPIGMLAIIVLRSLLHWLLKGAEMGIPVGQFASIVSSIAFCLTAHFTIQKLTVIKNDKVRLLFGLGVGAIVLSAVMFVANYFWITPFYFAIGNMPLPDNYLGYVLMYIPFNLIKGIANSAVIVVFAPYLAKLSARRNNITSVEEVA